MRPVVAIISARPETIADDYSRLLHLAGVSGHRPKAGSLLVLEGRQSNWMAGQVSPPWQVSSVLDGMDKSSERPISGPLLLSVNNSGPSAALRGRGWDEIFDRHNLSGMGADALAPAPFRPEALLPALESVLGQGFKISPHLRGKDLFLLSSMSLGAGGILGGHVALLDSLLTADRHVGKKIPEAEILAEVVGLANDVFSSMTVITDATVVSVARRGGAWVPLIRNLLIAGSDPVAVDSVLGSLAGLDPADSPWLRLCQDRGLGVASLNGINLVGETEWLDLDFQIPEDTFTSGNPVARWTPGSLWARMAGGTGEGQSSSLDSAWSRLYRDYQSGVTS